MDEQANRAPAPSTIVRLGLAVFVLAWILGPSVLRTYVPIWPVFLLALGLELHFFLEARRSLPALARSRGRGPQAIDRERYGYGADGAEDLLVVRDGGEDLWLPYSGESDEELEELIAEARARREEDEQQPEPESDWEPEPPPARRRPALRRLATGVALIGALAAALWVVESRSGWSGLDREARVEAVQLFSAEASRLAEKPVSIQCDESGEHVGVVQHADGAAIVGGNVAYLTPERCYDLYRLAFRGEVSSSQTARALAVLAHEAWHLRGIRDEGTTECYALQSAVEIGRRFGLSEESARQMMRQRLSENVLHRRGSPEYLVPAECRVGGSLDLNPDDPRFP